MTTPPSITVTGPNPASFLPGLLTIIFVVLKVTGTVGWSWWWVFAPLWVTGLLGVLVLLLVTVIAVVAAKAEL